VAARPGANSAEAHSCRPILFITGSRNNGSRRGGYQNFAAGKKCEAVLGIIAEGKEVIEEVDDAEVLDAGLVAFGQAAEHYEIARYGTLCAWAKLIGKPQIARLLHQTLEEEKKADALLSQIAERSLNQHALSA